MSEFLKLLTPEKAREIFYNALEPLEQMAVETCLTSEAFGRVLGREILAPHPLPPFTRSTVDGFAVIAQDTFGASPSLPAYLRLVAEISMGEEAQHTLQSQEVIQIHTGGMLPDGADAVIMLEDTQVSRPSEIEILKPVAPGENVILAGEDVEEGELVFSAGMFLGPQEIGGLMGLGITELDVVRKPQVAIISTGDEIIPPESEQEPGQIRDINTFSLSSLISTAGGKPKSYGIIPDDRDQLFQAVRHAHEESQVVIITAGSSVSYRDLTADVINDLGKPGVLVHGVAIKPGKPTILAVVEGKPLIGLPGNPVSALVVANLYLAPLIQKLLGLSDISLFEVRTATLSTNVASETGRDDFIPVKLTQIQDEFIAEPVYGRSNLIFTLIRADGLVHIPSKSTGLAKGESVNVRLFRRHP